MVDVVIAADPTVPHEDPNMAAAHAAPLESLGKLLPLFGLLRQPGSVSIHTAPGAASRYEYQTYAALQKVAAYRARGGTGPLLHFSPALCEWADMFLGKCGKRVITVNLRRNYDHHEHRNHNPGIWAEVLSVAATLFGVRFCVVGEAHETGLLPSGLAIIAKERHTSLLEDLALIHRSKAHIGSPSGPAMVATLGSAPYFIPGADMKPHLALYGGALREDSDGDLVYSFASPGQKWSPKPESVPLLVEAIGDLVERAFI